MMLLIPAPIACLGLVCSVCLTWCSVFSWPAYIILIWCTISCSCVGAEMLWWTAPSGTNTNTGFPSLGYLGGCNVLAWLIPSNTIYGMLKSNCWVIPSIPALLMAILHYSINRWMLPVPYHHMVWFTVLPMNPHPFVWTKHFLASLWLSGVNTFQIPHL